MNKSIPVGAARFLDLIGSVEAPHGYDTIFGNRQAELPKRVTLCTVDDVIEGRTTVDRRSSATGRYQFMGYTMKSLKKDLGLTGKEVLTPDFQDFLGYALMKRRGYYRFLTGKMSLVDYGKAIAQEWASFPVLADCQGQKRWVVRGQSYYSGDGLNKSLLKPERVEEALRYAFEMDKSKPGVVPVKESPMEPVTPSVVVTPSKVAIPWWKSPVLIGSGGGLGASLTAIVAVYRPGVPFLEQLDTLLPPVLAAVGSGVALLARVGSKAQPVTISQDNADRITLARTVVEPEQARPVPEAWAPPQGLGGALGMVAPQLGVAVALVQAVPQILGVLRQLHDATAPAAQAEPYDPSRGEG